MAEDLEWTVCLRGIVLFSSYIYFLLTEGRMKPPVLKTKDAFFYPKKSWEDGCRHCSTIAELGRLLPSGTQEQGSMGATVGGGRQMRAAAITELDCEGENGFACCSSFLCLSDLILSTQY